MSLRRRLIVIASIWIVAGTAIGGVLLSAIFRELVTQQFMDELHVHLEELQRLADISAAGALLQRDLSDPRYDVPDSGFYWEIQQGHSTVARSKSLEGPALDVPAVAPTDITIKSYSIAGPTGTLMVLEQAKWIDPAGEPVRFIIGTDKGHLDEIVHGFDSMVGYSLAAFAALMIGASVFLFFYAMRPFDQLRTALGMVRSGQSPALGGEFPNEVQPLVDDLNALLKSTAELIRRARVQAGNVAHGLKTPLAILTDEADRIEEQGLDKSAATILDQCRKMQKHIDYQITRARAVAMRDTPGMVASVSKAVAEVASALRRLHLARSISIESDVPHQASAACDAQDLNEMLANLVDNACKHANSLVRIRLSEPSRAARIAITVEDDGSGLSPDAYEVVFNVGERWDSRKPGAGLGLAIVRDLARLYGGDVQLGKSALGGLAAHLELPRAAELPGQPNTHGQDGSPSMR
jgi:signal transduction histidine kinase